MGQVTGKFKKGDPTPEQVDKLADDMKPIIDRVYDEDLNAQEVNYDDLYHAIYKIIQELRVKSGGMQYQLPSKEELQDAFDQYHPTKGASTRTLTKDPNQGASTRTLTKDECREIIKRVVKLENFSIGKGTADILMYLFAFPLCALMAKRIIPGMRSISDDVVIPAATSVSVIYLAKTHKL